MPGRADWGVPPSTLTQPPFAGPNDPSIVLFPDPIPPEIQAAIDAWFGAPGQNIPAAVLYKVNDTLYYFDALVSQFSNPNYTIAIFRGVIDGGFAAITEVHSWSNIAGLASARFGDGGSTIGPDIVVVGQELTHGIQLRRFSVIPPQFNMDSAGNMTIDAITAPAFTITMRAGEAGSSGVLTQTLLDLIGKGLRINNALAAITTGGRNDFVMDTISQARGLKFNFAATTNTASIGTGGTTLNLGSGYVLRAGRAYRATIGGGCSTSTATVRMGTDLTCVFSGGSVQFWGDAWFGPQVGPQNLPIHYEAIRRNTGVDRTITATNLLILSSAGTVTWNGGSGLTRYVVIEDIGAASQWSAFPSF